MNKKILISAAVLAILYVLTCMVSYAEWPMFRYDKLRTGAETMYTMSTTRPHPIWVFPAYTPPLDPVDNDHGAVDIPEYEAIVAGWTDSTTDPATHSPNAYDDNYQWADVTYSETEEWEAWDGPVVQWNFNITGSPASFYIYIWFPSSSTQQDPYTNSADAHYIVVRERSGDEVVLGRFKVDQSSGGTWINLGNRSFSADNGDIIHVRLTNETQEVNYFNKIVVADAVKIVRDTGTVMASPVVAIRDTGDVNDDLVVTSVTESRPLDVVEGQEPSRFVSVIYGLATEDLDLLDGIDDRGRWDVDDDGVGDSGWRFPANSDNWVEGIITSTPAMTVFGGNEYACAAGADGQVYVIKTSDGTLRWQGPGYMLYDPSSNSAGWDLDPGDHPGYQTDPSGGDTYKHILADATGDDTAEWTPSITTPGEYAIYAWIPSSTADETYIYDARYTIRYGDDIIEDNNMPITNPPGNDYFEIISGTWIESDPVAHAPNWYNDNYLYIDKVYSEIPLWDTWGNAKVSWTFDVVSDSTYTVDIWLPTDVPPVGYTETPTTDAHYIVKLDKRDNGGDISVVGRVSMDQTDGEDDWKTLPNLSVFAESGDKIVVELTNESQVNDGTQVFADAVRIVPGVNVQVNQTDGGRWVRLGDSYNLSADDLLNLSIQLSSMTSWGDGTPPANAYVAADAIKIVPADLGAFDFSSPVVDTDGTVGGTTIYVGNTDGRVYALQIDNPDPLWTYPDITENPAGAFYASPAFDAETNPATLYIASTDGHVYAVDLADGSEAWVYPLKGGDPDYSDTVFALGQISSTTAVGSNLYVAIGSGTSVGFSFDTTGRVVALDTTEPDTVGRGREVWWYPEIATPAASAGTFMYSSSLIMPIGSDGTLSIGSADGNLYTLNTAGASPGSLRVATDLLNNIYSSPAGTDVGYLDKTGGLLEEIAFVGTEGCSSARICGVDLVNGVTDWWWYLLGSGTASPALHRERIYTADTGGYTWAFSTKNTGGDGWNPAAGQLPTGGSEELGAGARTADPQFDVFTEDQYNTIVAAMKASQETNSKIADAYDTSNELRALARDAGSRSESTPFVYEWGEKIYLIAWNLLDPNHPNAGGTPGLLPTDPNFASKTRSAVSMQYKVTDPGDNSVGTGTQSFTEGGYFVTADGATDDLDTRMFYMVYTYSLDGSAGGKTQTPGTNIKFNFTESPKTDTSSSDKDAAGLTVIPVDYTADPLVAQPFSINNPLALEYEGTLIGLDSAYTSSRTALLAGVNGNKGSEPLIYVGAATHGTTSPQYPIAVCDRSLLGATAVNELSKVRVGRGDLLYPWDVVNDPVGFLPWEIHPPTVPNQPNVSDDYPDMRSRQVNCITAGSGIDIGAEATSIPGTIDPITDLDGTYSTPWNVGVQDTLVSVAVPQFQPASDGYNGQVSVFIDTNNNGRRDGSDLGGGALVNIKIGGAWAEAYRSFLIEADVPVDKRVEAQMNVLDIGQVAHGFGLTPDASDLLFHDTWADTLTDYPDWFKSFTLLNQGNTNLLNVKVSTHPEWDIVNGVYYLPEYIFSQTVQDPIYGIPALSVTSTLAAKYLDDLPHPLGYATRTFSKAKVGGTATMLRVPEAAPGFSAGQRPSLSIAVEPGTPVGTYSGMLTIYDDVGDDASVGADDDIYDLANEFVGNPQIPVKITVSEARMTDGFDPGSVANVDDDTSDAVTGDMSPTGFRDPYTGNLYMFFSSNRYPPGDPTAIDAWYIYATMLEYNTAGGEWSWNFYDNTHWWLPTDIYSNGYPWPGSDPSDIISTRAEYFPGPPNGSSGTFIPGSAKFGNPSIASDPGDTPEQRRAWLFFTGQASKETGDVSVMLNRSQNIEYRTYYAELTDPEDSNIFGLEGKIVYSTTDDWSMPKYNLKGTATRMGAADDLWLWSFWYGGSNDKWRIYYNGNPYPDGDSATSREGQECWLDIAQLPMPRGLTSIAEPSPVFRKNLGWDITKDPIEPIDDVFEMVCSGYSSFHKNSDIYLIRCKPDQDAVANGSEYVPMTMLSFPEVEEEVMKRAESTSVWSSDYIDWEDTDPVNDITVWVWPNGDKTSAIEVYPAGLTIDEIEIDKDTQMIACVYPDSHSLKDDYRALVLDPKFGTVKFLRPPAQEDKVVTRYTPQALRITTDTAADVSPSAFLDDAENPGYDSTNPSNPFYIPDGWTATDKPYTDRLWVFWRRPGLDKPGTGIHYKTYRHAIELDYQISSESSEIKSVEMLVDGTPQDITTPVEIDWANNRLYFMSDEEGAEVQVEYTDSTGTLRSGEIHTVKLIEEIGPGTGSSFGNLTSVMMNEGQINAFKDPWEERIWALWSSTRTGSTDIYYEAISPKFYGSELTP